MAVLGVDFGTSNSAVGITVEGAPHLIPVEQGATALTTAVFFDFAARRTVYGRVAQDALIAGEEGRYMRALKSLLGTSVMRERRRLLNETLDCITIIGRFLADLKARAEAATGQTFTHALSGRPVFFHSGDAKRNAQALTDLRECYLAAGFSDVSFMAEPEAAARANCAMLAPGHLGLVVDIGGGTSDFTVFRQGQHAGIDILANHGVRLGGTVFDRALSLSFVMPELGMGSAIRHAFGNQTHVAPNAIFHDLATWQKIPFLYTEDTRRAARELAQSGIERGKLDRLVRVLEEETGHDIAFAVEAAKIAANAQTGEHIGIDLSVAVHGLSAPLSSHAMTGALQVMAHNIAGVGETAVEMAGHAPPQVDQIILVGGSSLMHVVEDALRDRFPQAVMQRGNALTAIAEGLALVAGDHQSDGSTG